MRKNFLILMLMALLPLAGWATINVSTGPTLATGGDYDATAKQVIASAAVATAEGNLTISYALTTSSSAPDAAAENTWYEGIDNAKLKATAAGTYYAYYKIVSDNSGETAVGPTQITGTFVIAKVAATVKTAPAAKTLTYSGVAQDLVEAGASETGTLQYCLTSDGTFATTIPQQTNAGTYTVYYKVIGDANHNDLYDAETMKVTVTIKQKNLKVKASAYAYQPVFGVFQQNTAVGIEYDGWVNNEGTATGPTGTPSGWTAPTAAIADDVKADANCVTIASTKYIKAGNYPDGLVVTGGAADNYNLVLLNNDLNIAEASVKVEVAQAPTAAVYGSTAAAKTEWAVAYSETSTYAQVLPQDGWDADGNPTYTTTALSSNDDIAAYLTRTGAGTSAKPYAFGLKLTREDTSTAVGQYLVALSGATKTADVESIEYKNTNAYKFQINAATLTIAATNKFKTYGEADPKDEDGNWAYTVKSGTTAYDGLSTEQKALIAANLTREAGETVGDYEIQFDEDAIADNDLFKDNYTLTFTNGWLAIEKAELTITAAAQSLYKGNTVAKLGQVAGTDYTVEGLVANTDLGIADEAEVSLIFGTADVTTGQLESQVAVSAVEGHVGELTTATTYGYGIKIVLANQAALAENYDITMTYGALTVIDTDTKLVLSFTADNTEALEATSGKTNMTVQFGARNLAANTWGVMVLPFNTSVREISTALGYAVVDVLDQTKGDGSNVYFKLHMGDIAANTPFMVKSDAAVDFSATSVQFTGKTIVTTGITEGKTASVKDAGNTEFIGFYNSQSFTGEKQLWLSSDGVWGYNKNGNAVTVGPTRAYLQLPAESTGGAHIFIEEIDGSVTAISTINAEGEAVAADGWYTLNGIRLEGAPTEKGIYVRNGKKVVIK